jgi:hypothetical protein
MNRSIALSVCISMTGQAPMGAQRSCTAEMVHHGAFSMSLYIHRYKPEGGFQIKLEMG